MLPHLLLLTATIAQSMEYTLHAPVTGNQGQQLVLKGGVVMSTPSSATPRSTMSLQHFGFYDTNVTGPGLQPTAHSNLYLADSIHDAIAAEKAGLASLLVVSEYFPGLFTTVRTMYDLPLPSLCRIAHF